jgi:hypothetical protein
MKTRALPMSSDLSCSDLLSPFLKARHIWTITMVTTKSKLQMEFNKEVFIFTKKLKANVAVLKKKLHEFPFWKYMNTAYFKL